MGDNCFISFYYLSVLVYCNPAFAALNIGPYLQTYSHVQFMTLLYIHACDGVTRIGTYIEERQNLPQASLACLRPVRK